MYKILCNKIIKSIDIALKNIKLEDSNINKIY
jgi:hypothetical protein